MYAYKNGGFILIVSRRLIIVIGLTEWSPVRSVIIRVIDKISDLFNQEYGYRPNRTTQSSVTNQS